MRERLPFCCRACVGESRETVSCVLMLWRCAACATELGRASMALIPPESVRRRLALKVLSRLDGAN